MVFQMMFTIFVAIVLHVARPYVLTSNLVLALAAQWSIFALSFLAMLVKVNREAESLNLSTMNEDTLNALLVAIFVLVPATVSAQVLYRLSVGRLACSRQMENRASVAARRSQNFFGGV